MIQLLAGDCRTVLPTLAADSVQCVVCSPPYWNLRDYGTATWDGGDANCQHTFARQDTRLMLGSDGTLGKNCTSWTHRDATPPRQCSCGATRIDRQIGLEATPDEYLATMVAVFREVRRVLRPDGTVWCNMGSSYSNGKGSNVTDQLNRLIEGGSVFFTNACSVAVTGHGVGIALKHERAPDGELSGLLAAQRDGIEQRHQDLCKVADLFAGPGSACPRPASTGVLGHMPDTEIAFDEREHSPVIASGHDTQAETILAVLRSSGGGASEDDEATFTIHQADEPSVCGNVRWQPTWHAFAREALRKGVEDIHSVNDTIALGNRLHTMTGLLCDFRVAKASEKQITLASIHGGLTLAISDVGQLWFVLRCGSIVPYHKLLDEASRSANALLPKQDLGMPWRLARALQEDGWILRSPIIWHKPNPMPESTRDRPTSAHEHVFLLTKRSRYYYDADAVREEAEYGRREWSNVDGNLRRAGGNPGDAPSATVSGSNPSVGRACRNVWTIATHAYPSAHFATYPPELAERCIKAGTSEKGCCPQCGAPWYRVTERTFVPQPDVSLQRGVRLTSQHDAANQWPGTPRGTTNGVTTGWQPSCKCNAGDPVPCTILDPFAGAGTSLLVADRLQRNAIGIELNPDYTRLAMQRCQDDAPLFTSFPPASDDTYDSGMRDLFADAAE